MAKFKVTVTRVDEYEIEIDENVWDEKALEDWSGVFHPVSDAEDVAKDFAVAWMRNEDKYFIEGYGYVKEFDQSGNLKGVPYRDEKGEFAYPLPEDSYTKGISIVALSQDEDYETEVQELETVGK